MKPLFDFVVTLCAVGILVCIGYILYQIRVNRMIQRMNTEFESDTDKCKKKSAAQAKPSLFVFHTKEDNCHKSEEIDDFEEI